MCKRNLSVADVVYTAETTAVLAIALPASRTEPDRQQVSLSAFKMVRCGNSFFLVFAARAGIHFRNGHRPRGVTGDLGSVLVRRHLANRVKGSEN